jgi:hypothetical protein
LREMPALPIAAPPTAFVTVNRVLQGGRSANQFDSSVV